MWADDIRSAALEGLVKAARTYQPDGPAKFTTFAWMCVHAAVVDEQRRLLFGRNGSRDRRRECPYPDGFDPPAPNTDPAELVDQAADRDWALRLLNQIANPTNRTVARWYFLDGHTLADIGRLLGVTESRVCQRVADVRNQLAGRGVS